MIFMTKHLHIDLLIIHIKIINQITPVKYVGPKTFVKI